MYVDVIYYAVLFLLSLVAAFVMLYILLLQKHWRGPLGWVLSPEVSRQVRILRFLIIAVVIYVALIAVSVFNGRIQF
jgi:hypothetical protein